MLAALLTLLALFVGALLVVATAFVIGMRTKSPLVLGPIVAISRRYLNPRQLRGGAGSPGAYASIIRHIGRHSGRPYETPIGVLATDDGFVVALPYGRRTQWLRNVLAADEATLITEGRTVRVDRPELVPTVEVATCFSRVDQLSFRLMGTSECLRLRDATGATATVPDVSGAAVAA